MISHKYNCIFIHIAKCAGTSIEHAFGIDVNNHNAEENDFLYGWHNKHKLWLQHATPQQLIDLGLINESHWNNYYKFIVYRNSWDRAYSDYIWMENVRETKDTFTNFLNKSGNYERLLNDNKSKFYAGDHLNKQVDYFFLFGEEIEYDRAIAFSDLKNGLDLVIDDLNLPNGFFSEKLNSGKKIHPHYSKFYNTSKIELVNKKYREDIEHLNFHFEDERSLYEKIKNQLKS